LGQVVDNEAWACRQPGCLNGGTHLIFAARHKPDLEPDALLLI
jgi:hypothetical protein